MEVTEREAYLWSELGSHPNICRFIDAKIGPKGMQLPNGLMTGKSHDEFSYILCEYCNGGSLVNYLMKHSCRLSEQEIVECMIQICSGLEHLHALGMAHRDIKVENILVSYSVRGSQKIKGDPVFKLGDFGSTTKDHSINFDKCDKKEIGIFMEKIEEQCTRMYRAPEMIDRWQGYNVHGVATDMWMLGCVLYVLCTGNKHPF